MSRYSTSLRPVTAERIERARDRVAEIIVARGKQGDALLPLYHHRERFAGSPQERSTARRSVSNNCRVERRQDLRKFLG